MALFDHNSGQLVVGQHRSPPFSQPAGVFQGSVLIPLLYSVYIDPLVDTLRSQVDGVVLPIGDRAINCLLYADDIALISHTADGLARLLHVASEDSVLRGYRFSPQKCVVLSPLRPAPEFTLYGCPLTLADHFNYLGVEFSCRGINETRHVANRVRKAESSLFFLRSIGMNTLGFDPLTCIRLYKAFVRPGLEYGLPLLGRVSSTLDTLRLTQKRGLCAILGIDINSRIDVVDSVTGCPSFSVRQALLRCRRDRSIRSIWQSQNSDAYALTYTIRGLLGDDAIPPSLDDAVSQADVSASVMFSMVQPLTTSISAISDGSLSFLTLRRLLTLPAPFSHKRILLLWCLSKWRNFRPALCHHSLSRSLLRAGPHRGLYGHHV